MPGGTVDFITSTASPVPAGIASMTASTRLRSASPDALGGVSTHTKAIAALANRSAADVVNVMCSSPSASTSSTPGSWIGAIARAQALELGLVDVEADDLVPGLREARGGHEPDVADADDAEPLFRHVPRPVSRIRPARGLAGTRLLAIEIIVSGENLSSSELSIHTTAPPLALHGWPP